MAKAFDLLSTVASPLFILLTASIWPWAAAQAALPDLQTAILGGATAPNVVGVAGEGGSYTLTAHGRDLFAGKDEGAFAGLRTAEPNFSFTVRIARVAGGADRRKYGIAIRAGLEGPEKSVHLRYDGHENHRCLQWYMRYHVAPDPHEGSQRCLIHGVNPQWNQPTGLWLKLVRRYPYVDVKVSADGKTWTPAADYRPVLMPQEVWVGLEAAAGGDGKQPVSVTYDNISLVVEEKDATTETQASYKEYRPPMPIWRMHLVTVGQGKSEASAFLLMPRDMNPASIRAILYSAGSKEELVHGKPLEFDKEGGKRKPAAMREWEGVLDIEGIRPFNQLLSLYGLVRVGGYFPPEFYDQAVTKLAKLSGIAHLPNVPFVVTGASFAGGYSARAAALYPDRCIAAAPVIIGMAGAQATDPKVLATPHLHVFGSKDGPHLKNALEAAPLLRRSHALWASAPMWMVYHRQHKADALIYPYFIEMMRLRLPENADYTGPVPLRPLREEDGWLGLIETWESNYPQVVPFRDRKGVTNAVWLPNQKLARLWQAFASNNPRTVIHFPMFEGRDTYGGPQPHGWHNSFLPADESFELVASGPAGKDLRVDYYAGTKPLTVLKAHGGNPYRVTLQGLEPGLHAIYAVTSVGGQSEISRPVTVLFQKRPQQ